MTPDEAELLAREAQEVWDAAGDPRLISLRENAVYEVMLPETGRAVLRLHRRGYQGEIAVRSELWWLSALADRGHPVPRPLLTPDGAPLARIADGRIASMLSWIEGAQAGQGNVPLPGDAADQIRLMASIGRALGELHVTTDNLHLPSWFRRPRWDAEGLLGPDPLWGPFWEHPLADADERRLLAEMRRATADRLAAYAAQGADQGLIHADVLRENVLRTDHRAALIDFDDCGFGFRLYDLGTALSQSLTEPNLPEIVTALGEGYATIRGLTTADRAILPWMTLLRCLASAGWAVPRLAPDDSRQRIYLDRALRAAAILARGGDLFARP